MPMLGPRLFRGDHGWFDKLFLFNEESLRMPFVIRYPKEIAQAARAMRSSA